MWKRLRGVTAILTGPAGSLLAARFATPGAGPGGAWPSARQIFWIVVAMVGARSAAMTVNRIVDLRYDRANPRTSSRALPTGALTTGFAWMFAAASAAPTSLRAVSRSAS